VRNLTSLLLPRLTAAALTFVLALSVTSAWRVLPFFQPPPESSQRLVGMLTPAVFESLTWDDKLVRTESSFWILGHDDPAARFFDVNQPVALPNPDANLIRNGCMTLTVTVDADRTLMLNTDAVASLDDPSKLIATLAEIFREREVNRAYRPEMEDRAELPPHARIEKTVIVSPSHVLSYGEVLEVVRLIEQAGAGPVVLQVGDPEYPFYHSFKHFGL
jgi:biopolymer transport protein ExbD